MEENIFSLVDPFIPFNLSSLSTFHPFQPFPPSTLKPLPPMIDAIERLRALSVADVMTRDVIVVSCRQTLLDVARNFTEHDVTAAPVVDDDGRCVGFFSSADSLRRELPLSLQTTPPRDNDPLCVERYMTADVRTILPGESLLAAARLMCRRHLHRLPVVDDDGRVVGIVSTMDIVAALANAIDEMDAARG